MRNLCLGLSFVAMAVLAACGGDNGSSAGDIGESSSSSEIGIIESCASGEAPSSSSEKAESNTSEDSSSSESGDSSSSSSEDTGSSESGDSSSGSSEESSSSEFGDSSSSSSEDAGSSESGDLSSSSYEESSSSSEEESSSSVLWSSSDASIYNATANTLTDLRDGQVYRTTTIDINDVKHEISYSEVWMAENLNIETENSWCGGGDEYTEGDCSVYGRLYTWAAAVAKSEDECGSGNECGLGTGDIRGVCPKGWHLPSQSESFELFAAMGSSDVAGRELKSETGWNSYSGIENNDTYLFSALPAGRRFSSGYYFYKGDHAYFWSSTEYKNYRIAYYIGLYYNGDHANLNNDDKGLGLSVRCLKD